MKFEQESDPNKDAIMFISRNHNTLQDAIKETAPSKRTNKILVNFFIYFISFLRI